MSDWAFMKRMKLRREDGTLYLARLRIVQTPWFAVYLHRMENPDPGHDLHNHPWRFWSFILWGGYREERGVARHDGRVAYRRISIRERWSWRGFELAEAHRITALTHTPTWTLVFCGKRVREWGYHTRDGYVDRKAYTQRGLTAEGA